MNRNALTLTHIFIYLLTTSYISVISGCAKEPDVSSVPGYIEGVEIYDYEVTLNDSISRPTKNSLIANSIALNTDDVYNIVNLPTHTVCHIIKNLIFPKYDDTLPTIDMVVNGDIVILDASQSLPYGAGAVIHHDENLHFNRGCGTIMYADDSGYHTFSYSLYQYEDTLALVFNDLEDGRRWGTGIRRKPTLELIETNPENTTSNYEYYISENNNKYILSHDSIRIGFNLGEIIDFGQWRILKNTYYNEYDGVIEFSCDLDFDRKIFCGLESNDPNDDWHYHYSSVDMLFAYKLSPDSNSMHLKSIWGIVPDRLKDHLGATILGSQHEIVASQLPIEP